MKKLFLSSCVIVSCVLSTSANADWTDSIDHGWHTVKSLISGATSASSIHASSTKKVVIENWDEIEDKFTQLLKLKKDQQQAPLSSWTFQRTQDDYQEDIDALLNKIFAIISDEDLSQYQEELAYNSKRRREKNQALTKLKRQLRLSLNTNEQKELQQKITHTHKEITEIDQLKDKIISEIKTHLTAFGNHLNNEQVENLLIRVNADDILSMITVFPTIREFVSYLEKMTQDTHEDLTTAKKYYGMYVSLLELQIFIENQYIDKLKNQYIKRLDELQTQNLALIQETQNLISGSSAEERFVYQNNLRHQHFTLEAIKLYRTKLEQDLTKIYLAQSHLQKTYKVALNTYQTVDLSFSISTLIKSNTTLFDKIIKLQTPNLVEFKNTQMKEEFIKLTHQLKN